MRSTGLRGSVCVAAFMMGMRSCYRLTGPNPNRYLQGFLTGAIDAPYRRRCPTTPMLSGASLQSTCCCGPLYPLLPPAAEQFGVLAAVAGQPVSAAAGREEHRPAAQGAAQLQQLEGGQQGAGHLQQTVPEERPRAEHGAHHHHLQTALRRQHLLRRDGKERVIQEDPETWWLLLGQADFFQSQNFENGMVENILLSSQNPNMTFILTLK